MLFIGRALAGVCIGAISVAAPLYVSEIAEPRLRGTLGSLFQLQITLGVLFEYVIGGRKKFFDFLKVFIVLMRHLKSRSNSNTFINLFCVCNFYKCILRVLCSCLADRMFF